MGKKSLKSEDTNILVFRKWEIDLNKIILIQDRPEAVINRISPHGHKTKLAKLMKK